MTADEAFDAGDTQFGLVMPFVVCQSQGGPYDDAAFVAGYECALLDSVLRQRPDAVDQNVHSACVPQIDLIAMQHGYKLTAEPWADDPETWTVVHLVRSPAEVAL